MANEIQLSARVQVAKNGATFSASGTKSLDQTGNIVVNQVQVIGNAAEPVDIGDIGTVGMVYLQNLNDAEGFAIYFCLGNDPVNKRFGYLNAGEFMLYRPTNDAPLYAYSAAGTSRLLVLLVEQ